MNIASIKILLALIIIAFLSTNVFAETNVTEITIVTDSSWKVIDAKIDDGWASIEFDDSYWANAKKIGEDDNPQQIIYPATPTVVPFYYRKTFYLNGTKIISGMLFDATPCEVVYVFGACTPPTYYVNGKSVSLLEKKNEVIPGYPSRYSLLNDINQSLRLGKNVIAVIATADSKGKIASTVKIRMVGSPVTPTPSPSPTPTPITPTPTPTPIITPVQTTSAQISPAPTIQEPTISAPYQVIKDNIFLVSAIATIITAYFTYILTYKR